MRIDEPALLSSAGGDAVGPAKHESRPAEEPNATLSGEVIRNIVGSGATRGVPAHRIRGHESALAFVTHRLNKLLTQLIGTDGEIAENAAALENQAFDVLEVLAPNKIGEAEAAFDRWFSDVEWRATSGEKLNAMEHLTLLHVMKTGIFEKRPELASYLPRMETALVTSNLKLTGRKKTLDKILGKRMPRRYLVKQSEDAQKIHAAIFGAKSDGLLETFGNLAMNYVPSVKDAIIGVGLLGLLLTGAGAPLLAGAVHGYLLATVIEHAIHEHIGHATPESLVRIEENLSRFGPIGKCIYEQIETMAFSHGKIHHLEYSGNYVEPCAPRDTSLPEAEREALTAKKKALVAKLIEGQSDSTVAQVDDSDHGRRLADALKAALYAAPVTTIASLITAGVANAMGADLGALFVVTSVLTSLIFIPASNYLHPYLHLSREEAMKTAGRFMSMFLNSRYVAYIAKAHHAHHRDVRVNHNLVAGADYILGYGPSKVDAIVELRKVKTFY